MHVILHNQSKVKSLCLFPGRRLSGSKCVLIQVESRLILWNGSSLHRLTYQSAQDHLSQSPRSHISMGFSWSLLSTSFIFPFVLLVPTQPFIHSFSRKHHNLVVQAGNPEITLHSSYLLTQLPLSSLFGLSSLAGWSSDTTFQSSDFGQGLVEMHIELYHCPYEPWCSPQPHPLVFTSPHLPLQVIASLLPALRVLARGNFSPLPKSGRSFNNTV